MAHKNIFNYIVTTGLVLAVLLTLLGCETPYAGKKAGTEIKTEIPVSPAASAKGSAQLWSENCGRCHNIRNPASYSDTEWQVAMHHMRVRANLTGEEHRRILEYLQASN